MEEASCFKAVVYRLACKQGTKLQSQSQRHLLTTCVK